MYNSGLEISSGVSEWEGEKRERNVNSYRLDDSDADHFTSFLSHFFFFLWYLRGLRVLRDVHFDSARVLHLQHLIMVHYK